MKKFIQWLAKIFNANITITTTETVVKEVEKVVEKKVYVHDDKVIKGHLTVEGDLVVEGSLEVYGTICASGNICGYGNKSNIECLKK